MRLMWVIGGKGGLLRMLKGGMTSAVMALIVVVVGSHVDATEDVAREKGGMKIVELQARSELGQVGRQMRRWHKFLTRVIKEKKGKSVSGNTLCSEHCHCLCRDSMMILREL